MKAISVCILIFTIAMMFKAREDFLLSLPVPVDLRETVIQSKEAVQLNQKKTLPTETGHVAIIHEDIKIKDTYAISKDVSDEKNTTNKSIKIIEPTDNSTKSILANKNKGKTSKNPQPIITPKNIEQSMPSQSAPAQVETKPKNGIDPTTVFWVKVAFSAFFGISAMFVVLSNRYDRDTKKWAFSALTMIAGVWIGSVT